jgi:Flp pilus assembly protein TadG
MKTIGRSVFRGRGLAAFHEDRGGAVLMTFGLLLPVVLGLLVLVFSYSRASSYKSGLQSAADSAALATTAAVIANPSMTSDQQQALANLYFANNAPAGAASLGSLTVPTATNFNSTVTTKVQYQGSLPALLNGLLSTSVSVNSTAQGVIPNTSGGASGNTTYGGYVAAWGDPHINAANGSTYYVSCAQPIGSWYNMLSDSGIEVNVSCEHEAYYNEDVMRHYSVVLGGHVIALDAPAPTETIDPNTGSVVISYDPATAWFGQVTIDGVLYPAQMGTQTYLNGAVSVNTTDVTNFYQQDNSVTFTPPGGNYRIVISFQQLGMGVINVWATNAGLCGVPGGILGSTIAGINDANSLDFQVAGPTATSFQYSWGSCATAAVAPGAGSAHLIR